MFLKPHLAAVLRSNSRGQKWKEENRQEAAEAPQVRGGQQQEWWREHWPDFEPVLKEEPVGFLMIGLEREKGSSDNSKSGVALK
jgi:hypothetical protein